MTRFRISQGAVDLPRRGRPLLGVALALALTLFLGAPAAAAVSKDTALSSEDKVCLDCHAKPGLRKTLANGESMPLYIAPNGFAESVHNSSGCEGCHSDIDAKAHSKEPKVVKSRREHSQGLMETCRDCHKKTMKQYEDSVHSAQVQAGSAKAPLCSDCHDPHATRSAKDSAGGDNVACQQCHKGVSQAFAASIHGASGDEACAGASHLPTRTRTSPLGEFDVVVEMASRERWVVHASAQLSVGIGSPAASAVAAASARFSTILWTKIEFGLVSQLASTLM